MSQGQLGKLDKLATFAFTKEFRKTPIDPTKWILVQQKKCLLIKALMLYDVLFKFVSSCVDES